MPVAVRTGWVSPHEPLTLTRHCALTGVTRSTLYAPHPAATPDEQAWTLLGLIDAEYTRHPFYGSRKIMVYLRGRGHRINRKRVQRLMGILGSRVWRRGRTRVAPTRSTGCSPICSEA